MTSLTIRAAFRVHRQPWSMLGPSEGDARNVGRTQTGAEEEPAQKLLKRRSEKQRLSWTWRTSCRLMRLWKTLREWRRCSLLWTPWRWRWSWWGSHWELSRVRHAPAKSWWCATRIIKTVWPNPFGQARTLFDVTNRVSCKHDRILNTHRTLFTTIKSTVKRTRCKYQPPPLCE